jgi:hypothetical protein
VVIEYIDRYGEPPSARQVFQHETGHGLYATFLEENKIGSIVAKPIPGNSFLTNMVRELRDAGLFDSGKSQMIPTPAGRRLTDTFQPEDNRPFSIRVDRHGSFDPEAVQLPLG